MFKIPVDTTERQEININLEDKLFIIRLLFSSIHEAWFMSLYHNVEGNRENIQGFTRLTANSYFKKNFLKGLDGDFYVAIMNKSLNFLPIFEPTKLDSFNTDFELWYVTAKEVKILKNA